VPGPAVLVDAGALIALFNKTNSEHQFFRGFFADYYGEALTTWRDNGPQGLRVLSHAVGPRAPYPPAAGLIARRVLAASLENFLFFPSIGQPRGLSKCRYE